MQSDDVAVDRLFSGLPEVTAGFAEAVAGLDPQSTVPTCPEWRVRDLVGHIGQAHRWSAGLVRSRSAAPPPDPLDADPGHPQHWAGWLHAGAAELVDAVAEAGPETPVWAFVGEQPARFWVRRMVADTAVHQADAALTAGRPYSIAADLAAETLSEGLWLISSAVAADLKPALAELRGAGETIQLRPAAATEGWLITRTPTGVTWERRTGDADVVVTAPVQDLLLVFSRRIAPDDGRLTVTGDRAVLDHWWARTAF